jgi:hypothetical protein
MNTPTLWEKRVISDTEVHYISETTLSGSIVAKATLEGGEVKFSTDNVPFFVIERAHQHFGI